MTTIIVTSKYITFPVRRTAEQKKVRFLRGGTLVYDLDVHLDAENPDFAAYADLSRFAGGTLDLVIDGAPEDAVPFGTADVIPDDTPAMAALRPAVRFTVKNGWNNDPNGLCFYEGQYHMFFQYNPCGPMWGNMHWGHAVSADLLHWTEGDIALYPNEHGTMYSGSAITDTRNLLGLKTGAHDPLLLYYTAAGGGNALSDGQPATQRMAYSTDGGATYHDYPACVIPHITGYNRDPKVVWVQELGCYVMVLYLDGNEYAFFRSDDLIHWTETQRLSIPWDSECPNLVRVPVEGTGEHRWVFFGAAGRYTVGVFENGVYVPVQEAVRPCANTACYAGQCFDNVGDEAIRIDWLVSNMQGCRFSQAMSVPLAMTLCPAGDGFILREQPIAALDAYLADDPAGCRALDVRVSIPDAAALTQPFTLTLFGKTLTVDAQANEVSDNAVRNDPFGCPLSVDPSDPHRALSLRLVADAAGIEVFADGGLRFFATRACPSPLDARVSVSGLPDTAGSVTVRGIRLEKEAEGARRT